MSDTLIGKGFLIEGEIIGDGSITILGTVKGKIETNSFVTIEQEAEVEAEIEASVVTISGNVTGNIEANDKIIIEETGEMIGNIHAKKVSIKEGAVFKGQIDMG